MTLNPEFRGASEPTLLEYVRAAIDWRRWDWAGEMCRDGMDLRLTEEEALLLSAHLPDSLRIDRGEGDMWHVLAEGFSSW